MSPALSCMLSLQALPYGCCALMGAVHRRAQAIPSPLACCQLSNVGQRGRLAIGAADDLQATHAGQDGSRQSLLETHVLSGASCKGLCAPQHPGDHCQARALAGGSPSRQLTLAWQQSADAMHSHRASQLLRS
jgi:hypothetical protein